MKTYENTPAVGHSSKGRKYALIKRNSKKARIRISSLHKKDAGLTTGHSKVKILKSALLKKDNLKLNKLLFNSLEEISTALYPVINKLRSAFSDLGLKTILMSGSGPTVFGLVFSRKEADRTARQLKKLGDWDVFVARTV